VRVCERIQSGRGSTNRSHAVLSFPVPTGLNSFPANASGTTFYRLSLSTLSPDFLYQCWFAEEAVATGHCEARDYGRITAIPAQSRTGSSILPTGAIFPLRYTASRLQPCRWASAKPSTAPLARRGKLLSTPQCSIGITQSRRHSARAEKIMESARHYAKAPECKLRGHAFAGDSFAVFTHRRYRALESSALLL
jgi:hypothetical protein